MVKTSACANEKVLSADDLNVYQLIRGFLTGNRNLKKSKSNCNSLTELSVWVTANGCYRVCAFHRLLCIVTLVGATIYPLDGRSVLAYPNGI